MPRLSDTMERGTVARWLKAVGDTVHAGDVVAEIETDKATMEYQSDLDGVILQILVGDGESADLGAVIALVGEAGEEVPEAAAPTEPAPEDGSGGARRPAARGEPAPAAEAEAPRGHGRRARDGGCRLPPTEPRRGSRAGR